MNVCAIPVGQEVTPTITFLPDGADPPPPAGSSPAGSSPAGVWAGASASGAAACRAEASCEADAFPSSAGEPATCSVAASSSSGWTCPVTMRVTSSALAAARSASVNASFISPRASLARS